MEPADRLTQDLISCDEAGTLPALFRLRCQKTPDRRAYRQYDIASGAWHSYTWREMRAFVNQWQGALEREHLEPGDRVAVLLKNSIEWVCFDQAAQSLGLVLVPLYMTDSTENLAYILGDCGARLLLVGEVGQWNALVPLQARFPRLQRVICAGPPGAAPLGHSGAAQSFLAEWLTEAAGPLLAHPADPNALATIVYTSGTTGRAKGVMLSHRNILSNAEAVLALVPGYREDLYLSFLPLSHSFERTVGYYVPIMAGSTVAFVRSVQQLPEDLRAIRPTMLVSVPRIYERLHAKVQQRLEQQGAPAKALFEWAEKIGWQRFEAAQHRGKEPGLMADMSWPLLRQLVADKLCAQLGGRLRIAVSGGAQLSPRLFHCFVSLGLPLLQGYGLTEASPVVTANTLEDNVPASVGRALPGVEIRLGERDELLVRGPNVMLGYWNDPEKTSEAIDAEGWLHTGDVARIEPDDHVFIVGRLKEILVMSTGEKVAPEDLELAITEDPLFEQAMVAGESKPYLVALVVLNARDWGRFARALAIDGADPKSLEAEAVTKAVRDRIGALLRGFPAYGQMRAVWLTLDPWTIEAGLITPTMKLRRSELERRFADDIRKLYAGHHLPE